MIVEVLRAHGLRITEMVDDGRGDMWTAAYEIEQRLFPPLTSTSTQTQIDNIEIRKMAEASPYVEIPMPAEGLPRLINALASWMPGDCSNDDLTAMLREAAVALAALDVTEEQR